MQPNFSITHSFCTMAFLIIDFLEFLVFSSVIFLYMKKYFKWFWTEVGHIQFTIIVSLVEFGQTQEVNEIMRQTLIHGALNLERLGRHGTFKSWALCLER